MERRILGLAAVLAVAAFLPGCILVLDDDSPGDRPDDRYVPDARDPGPGDPVPPDATPADPGAPDAAVDTSWMDLPRPDAPGDVPPDAPPADAGPGDVPPDAPPACPPVAEPAWVNFDVWGFPHPGGRSDPWGEGVLQGDGVLSSVEPTRSGTRWAFDMDDGTEVAVETDLPAAESIPFAPGDRVRLYAKQSVPWWRDLVLVLWDGEGWPRFLYHDAATLNEAGAWFDCGGEGPLCPVARGLPDDCPYVEGTCGMRQHPPVELLAFGGVASSEIPPAFRQGESGTSPTNARIFYRVHEAYRIDPGTYPCADYPTQWLRALIRVAPVPAAACDESKIGFPQDNPDRFEFYEICLPAGDDGAEAAAKAIDPSLYCGVSGVFAGCAKNGWSGCHGDLRFDDGSRRIDDATWGRLCALSMLEAVKAFGGGYWL